MKKGQKPSRHKRTSKYGKKFPVNPHISKKVMKKHKGKTYEQLRRRFGIHPLKDDDKDGVRNKDDCRPWDKKRQDDYKQKYGFKKREYWDDIDNFMIDASNYQETQVPVGYFRRSGEQLKSNRKRFLDQAEFEEQDLFEMMQNAKD